MLIYQKDPEGMSRGFLKWGYPQIIHFNRIFHYKPSSYWGSPILGNPHVGDGIHNFLPSPALSFPSQSPPSSPCGAGPTRYWPWPMVAAGPKPAPCCSFDVTMTMNEA